MKFTWRNLLKSLPAILEAVAGLLRKKDAGAPPPLEDPGNSAPDSRRGAPAPDPEDRP